MVASVNKVFDPSEVDVVKRVARTMTPISILTCPSAEILWETIDVGAVMAAGSEEPAVPMGSLSLIIN